MDAKTRQVMAFHVGDRSRRSAKRLWVKIPQANRQHTMFYTDQYAVYAGGIAPGDQQGGPQDQSH
jgi:insertion element IS1 protein InsB